jgi:hypothetical protein
MIRYFFIDSNRERMCRFADTHAFSNHLNVHSNAQRRAIDEEVIPSVLAIEMPADRPTVHDFSHSSDGSTTILTSPTITTCGCFDATWPDQNLHESDL